MTRFTADRHPMTQRLRLCWKRPTLHSSHACDLPTLKGRDFLMLREFSCQVTKVGAKVFDNAKVSDHYAIIPMEKGLKQAS